jgi:FKBP-type peptidyl-prolyl cis-trans isomerase SlyD
MVIAKDRVAGFDYTLAGSDNSVIDSSEHTGPLFYLHGYENIIPGLENALEGKAAGDAFSVRVPASEAYGEWDKNLVIAVSRGLFPPEVEVREGMRFEADTPDGCRMVTVTKVTETEALVDANHPMAGMDLSFDIHIRSVRESSDEEREHGHPHEAASCSGGACGAENGCGACSACCPPEN